MAGLASQLFDAKRKVWELEDTLIAASRLHVGLSVDGRPRPLDVPFVAGALTAEKPAIPFRYPNPATVIGA